MRRLVLPSAGTLLVHDTFSGSDGDTLDGRYPDTVNVQGTVWEKDNKFDLQINSNKLTFLSALVEDDNQYKENDHIIEVGCTGVVIECDLNIVSTTGNINLGVLLRYVNPQAHIAFLWQSAPGQPALHAMVFRRQNGTAATDIAGLQFSDASGLYTEQRVRIVDDGKTISATLLGQTISVASSNAGLEHATKVGVKTNDFNLQTWNNFKVWKT